MPTSFSAAYQPPADVWRHTTARLRPPNPVMPFACLRQAALRSSTLVGMRDGDSSSSELSAKDPISSFDGAVLERVGLGREELLDEGFGDLGDLGDFERFLGVEGEDFDVSSLTGTTFGATGFDGASFGDDAFAVEGFELETFGVEGFEGADLDAFAGVDGTLFDDAAFGGGLCSFFSCFSSFSRCFRRDGVAGDVGVVVIGVGV